MAEINCFSISLPDRAGLVSLKSSSVEDSISAAFQDTETLLHGPMPDYISHIGAIDGGINPVYTETKKMVQRLAQVLDAMK
jgi:hypothetical protein